MKYRKKAVVVEAIQWKGDNWNELENFIDKTIVSREMWFEEKKIKIKTLEGVMEANVGDYIIKGVSGEYYPCKPDIFNKTYEKVEGEQQ